MCRRFHLEILLLSLVHSGVLGYYRRIEPQKTRMRGEMDLTKRRSIDDPKEEVKQVQRLV